MARARAMHRIFANSSHATGLAGVEENILRWHGRAILRRMRRRVNSVIGFIAACITSAGINASRQAMDKVQKDWHQYNDTLKIAPEMAPNAFGHGVTSRQGTYYAIAIPRLFIIMWLGYFAAYAWVVVPDVRMHVCSARHC
jgi:hypothetical protein